MLIKGILHFYSETGTEGGYWAIQDENNIHKDLSIPGEIKWDYEGLHLLQTGDYLKIFDHFGNIYWEGIIDLKEYDVFSESIDGLWIHSDQIDVPRTFWAIPFLHEYRGELTTKPIEMIKSNNLWSKLLKYFEKAKHQVDVSYTMGWPRSVIDALIDGKMFSKK